MNIDTALHLSKEDDRIGGLTHVIEAGKQYTIGEFKIIPFSVKHDVSCLGFLINHPESGNILFVTDTRYISNRFKGLNQILIEATYEKGY
ncbi:MAG: hypothetical protein ACK5MK_04245 [Dysgonomonas sp.]